MPVCYIREGRANNFFTFDSEKNIVYKKNSFNISEEISSNKTLFQIVEIMISKIQEYYKIIDENEKKIFLEEFFKNGKWNF